eukprot:CAMPEP_0115830236 /NCGR_PEP_ID=MMETSP0287-20121206/1515_1 /TAXON_ID=412157 /ORGANISM="Chrysochromulina rotalis, Strain UIO044" /LENGTH=568 /DNA_ID=CAMNT_0003283537 /DNA_START=154 /DNA_END=1860 /DNA_ORIENTATION=-
MRRTCFGAWISQDLVRKANKDSPGPHHMHGNSVEGYEVMPSNVGATAEALKLTFEEWDYLQPKPQAAAYKKWLKRQLVRGHPIVWFPICKGDSHDPYPGSCPGGGAVDHVEPMWGIFSNHSLDDEDVYNDDWILHASDQDYQPYYRPLNSLDDSTSMTGNCLHAQPGFGKNEMYPCFDEQITYGLAVTGLNITGTTLPVYLSTEGAVYEPQIRSGETPSHLRAIATISGLTVGSRYTVYRYDSTVALPPSTSSMAGYTSSHNFVASATEYQYSDPKAFLSSSAVYYVAVPSTSNDTFEGVADSAPVVPGLELPLVSLGTGSGQHADVVEAASLWISLGGTAIDTAFIYNDEVDVAAGIAQAGVPPSSIYLTTKIPCGTYTQAKAYIDSNLRQLQVPSVNLTLIHFPHCSAPGQSVAATWQALEEARAAGKTANIGVSNFEAADFEALRKSATVWPPALNQGSMSVGYHDDATIRYCDENKIIYMAYSPLCGGSNGSSCTHGSVLDIPEVQGIAASHGVSTAQVALKWIVQQGRPLATAVAQEEYAREDLDLWSWGNLTDDEMSTLTAV